MGQNLQNRLAALRRDDHNPINVNLLQPSDVDTLYRLNDGRSIDAAVITDLDKRFFEQANRERYPSLWGMRNTLERLGPERLMNDLVTFAGQATHRYLESQAIHAIDHLGKRFTPSDPTFEAQVIKLVQNGNPWIEKPAHFWLEEEVRPTIRTSRYIALTKDEGSAANVRFQEILDRNRDIDSQYVASSPDRVYVVSETAGQPLMALPNLENYRDNAYRQLIRNEAVHSDQNIDKFGDLLPKAPEEAKHYKQVLKSFAQGLLLGILKVRIIKGGRGPEQRLSVSMVDETVIGGRDEDLGPLSVAIWQLTRDAGRRWLTQLNKAVRDHMDTWGEEEVIHFVALLHHNGTSGSVPHGDLARAMTALAAKEVENNPTIKNQVNKEIRNIGKWATEKPQRSGVYIMDLTNKVYS